MLFLALALTLAAPPTARLNYKAKCLYCHSEEVTESRRFTEPQWRKIIESMRSKAPLLITRSDVISLTRYITHTLKLVEPTSPRPPAPAREVKPPPVLQPPPVVEAPSPPPPDEETPQVDAELEQRASELIQRRCSKCHSLGRVYGRLDTLERSLSTLERMRFKTGSGITNLEMKLLQDYLRSQF